MEDHPAAVAIAIDKWEQIRRAALHDPILAHMCHMIEIGMSREEALLVAVLGLAQIKDALLEDVKQLMMRRPAAPIIIEAPKGYKF